MASPIKPECKELGVRLMWSWCWIKSAYNSLLPPTLATEAEKAGYPPLTKEQESIAIDDTKRNLDFAEGRWKTSKNAALFSSLKEQADKHIAAKEYGEAGDIIFDLMNKVEDTLFEEFTKCEMGRT